MATHVLKDCAIYYDGYIFSSNINNVQFNYGARMLDAGTFGNDTEINAAGPFTASATASGFWDADASTYNPDLKLWGDVGSDDKLFSAFPETTTAGSRGFGLLTSRAAYNVSGAWGDLFKFDAEGASRSRLLQLEVIENSTQTSSTSGSYETVGAVAANQKVYAIMHVTSVSGTNPTLDVTIESTGGTNRFTFAQATAVGAQYLTPVAGAIADTTWRASWTIGGTDTPTFTFLVAIAIMYNLGETV